MPCEKQLTKAIPKIYKWSFENIALFFFVKGQQQVNPKIKIKDAINNYLQLVNNNIDDWDFLSAASIYTRMQLEFTDYLYQEIIKHNETSPEIK